MNPFTILAPLGAEPPDTTIDTTATSVPGVTGGGDGSPDLNNVLWFGGAVLVIFTLLVLMTGGGRSSTARFRTIARVYALLGLGVVGMALAFSSLADTARTAAFTLLGTIAGYLAGASGTTESQTQGNPPPEGDVVANVL